MNNNNTEPYFEVDGKLILRSKLLELNEEKIREQLKLIEQEIALKDFLKQNDIREMDDQLYGFLKPDIKAESTFGTNIKEFFKDYDYELLKRQYNALRLIVTGSGKAMNDQKRTRFW